LPSAARQGVRGEINDVAVRRSPVEDTASHSARSGSSPTMARSRAVGTYRRRFHRIRGS
jgi:hypothetical protein